MTDTTLFIIGGLVSFLVVGGMLQANLYRALRAPERDSSRDPLAAREKHTDRRAKHSHEALTAWQTRNALAALQQSASDEVSEPHQPDIH